MVKMMRKVMFQSSRQTGRQTDRQTDGQTGTIKVNGTSIRLTPILVNKSCYNTPKVDPHSSLNSNADFGMSTAV